MASVIASARRSTASVFDVVTDVSTAASRTLASATLAADTLHLKARELHNSVQARTISNMVITDRREIMLAAKDYVDLLEEMHRELYPNQQFDRATQTSAIITEMTKALEEERGA